MTHKKKSRREGMSTPTEVAKVIEEIVISALSDERAEAEGWKALYLSLRRAQCDRCGARVVAHTNISGCIGCGAMNCCAACCEIKNLKLELDVEIVKKRTAEHNFENLKASIPNPSYSQAEVDRIVAAKMAQLQAKDGG